MKRKAINSTIRSESNSYPGYYKYDITVLEEDGEKVTYPAYGKDMQDALRRLNLIQTVERNESLMNFIYVLVWLFTIVIPTLLVTTSHLYISLAGWLKVIVLLTSLILSTAAIYGLYKIVVKYFNKK